MKLICTPGWTIESISNEQAYYNWLNSIKDGDLIVQQEFIPVRKGLFDLGYRMLEIYFRSSKWKQNVY
jgi:hypothetical protein